MDEDDKAIAFTEYELRDLVEHLTIYTGEEFDAFIDNVRAKAWTEGFLERGEYASVGDDYVRTKCPYRATALEQGAGE